MKLKKVIATGLITAMLAGSCLSVSAAPASAAYQLTEKQASLILDVEAYKQAYPDLAAAFGNNTKLYVNHYLTHGVYEGRTKGVLFNPLAYAEAYGDVKAAFGDDINALVNHYVNYGVAENRTAGTSRSYAGTPLSYASLAAARNSGATNYYIPSAIATNYKDFIPVGNSASAGGNSQNAVTTGGSSLATTWNYDRSVAVFENGTLSRIEYYDKNNQMIRYSDVTNVNGTNSYTETIYYYDKENDREVLDRTDTYTNGSLASSVAGSN